jgi:flagellar protein FliL
MNKKIIIIIAVVVVLAVALVGGVYFGMKFAGNGEGSGEVDVLSEEVTQIEVGEMYSNISESKKIAKMNITIAVNDPDLQVLMESRMSIIKDEINKSVRGKTEEDLVGANGQINLKTELINKLNEIFKTEHIVDVYFNEFIVQ